MQLVPMKDAEFEPFMAISMQDQADGQVQAGRWQADEAQANIEKLREQFLPQGLQTPNHFFFTLETDTQEKAGGLWYAVVEQEGQKQVYVMDIQVFPEFRRRGFATQAFQQMEANVLALGITTIALHVFKHNHGARALYEKLGYVGPDEAMVKHLTP